MSRDLLHSRMMAIDVEAYERTLREPALVTCKAGARSAQVERGPQMGRIAFAGNNGSIRAANRSAAIAQPKASTMHIKQSPIRLDVIDLDQTTHFRHRR